jgi:hypothetical protein
MTKFRVTDYDIIYLSYDEPNAEKNYADLVTKVPWAKRVHGVKGSDSAHKACAKLSDTDRFITVDGDNIVRADFVNQELDIDDNVDMSRSVISWGAYNIINGLIYGNGGIKCWPKQFVLDMRTHENADPNNPKSQVDFCWDAQYLQQNTCYSDIHNNASPLQAWRAGFREGVKMSLIEGSRLADPGQTRSMIHWKNLERLMVWGHVGMDVSNGIWAIYGARQGCYMTNLTSWNYHNVRDFDYLNTLWANTVSKEIDEYNILEKIESLGSEITKNLDIPMGTIDSNASKFFKTVYRNPPRTKVT